MIFIFDSTTLIYFSKIKILNIFGNLDATKIIPELVYDEVVLQGKQKGEEDALLVEKLIANGIFKVHKAKDKAFLSYLLNIPSLDEADAETLTLAKELNGTAILDETSSRNVAEIENINYHGSIYLLFLLYKQNLIAKNEIKAYVDQMIKLGWRCSTEFYATILEEIDKLSQ